MARSDLLLQLIESGIKGDKPLFRKAVEAIIAEERSRNHKLYADKIEGIIQLAGIHENKKPTYFMPNNRSEQRVDNLFYESEPTLNFRELVLSTYIQSSFSEFIEEHNRADILRSYGLEPRHRMLLIGPPGNGKTSIAEAIAYEASLPFYSVKYEGLIGSYLGETSSKLKTLFDFIRTQRCVVFFDEFDTIGKERGDEHETGEIKRVVSSLLLQIDKLPSYTIVIAATNHPELLDRAVWRRFQLKINVPNPTETEIVEFITKFQTRYKINFGIPDLTIAKQFHGRSFSEVKDFCLDVLRRYILSQPNGKTNLKNIVKNYIDNNHQSYKP